jgi:hypothetical protein
MADEPLITSSGMPVMPFPKIPSSFFKQTTLILGASSSGKTFLIDNIMGLLKSCIPNIVVFCPSDAVNSSYSNKVPGSLIKDKITEDILREIWDRQKFATEVCMCANNRQNLQDIFHKMHRAVNLFNPEKADILKRYPNQHEAMNYMQASIKFIRSLTVNLKTNITAMTRKMTKKTISACKDSIEKLEKEYDSMVIEIYKLNIARFKIFLDDDKLTDKEKLVIEFLYFNPNMLLIFDDCAKEIKAFVKHDKDEIFSNLFYKGRHYNITTVASFQDDKDVDTSIKRNAMSIIMTTQEVASIYFGRASLCFSKHMKKMAIEATEAIFQNEDEETYEYAKLVYRRLDTAHPFKFIIADYMPDYTFCCVPTQALCKSAENDSDIDMSNPYAKRFLSQTNI